MIVRWIVLARAEASQIRARALTNGTDSGAMLAEVGLQSRLVPSDITDGLDAAKLGELDAVFHAGVASGRIARVKIWSPEGRIVYSDDHSLIGRTFPVASDLREAPRGATASEVSP